MKKIIGTLATVGLVFGLATVNLWLFVASVALLMIAGAETL